jgi:glycerophosphoryl diester phosphodiesterase
VRCPPRRRDDLPIGFAHRGARAECRDNTLVSFRRALELGARGLESDVWSTDDGVVVLDHDGLVRRGLRRVPIAQTARADLPGHIPELVELFALADAGVDVSLDVKGPGSAAATISAAEAAGRADRVWLCGHGPDLARWRQRSTIIRLVDSTRLSQIPEGMAARVARRCDEGVDAVNLRGSEWTGTLVETVHDAGLLAFAWDAQRTATLTALLRLGVDGVYSDHVARMVEVLTHPPGPQPPGSEPVEA